MLWDAFMAGLRPLFREYVRSERDLLQQATL